MLKDTVASLELEKVGFLDKIAILEHGVQKFKSDLNYFSLKIANVQASMVRLENRVRKEEEDMSWVLSTAITNVVDKPIIDSSFYDANRDLQTICVDYGRREGCEMMNAEHNLGMSPTDIPLYDPTLFQKMEEAFSDLFCGDYLSELGFSLTSMEHLQNLLGSHGDGGAFKSFGGGVGD